jgi:uncharacterized membrane protein (DUF2068 family)
MNRPIGITVIALFDFLAAMFFLLVGLLMALGMGLAGMSNDVGGGAAAMLAGLGIVGAVIFFACAVLCALMGWGLWTLKNWARIITLVFAFIGLGFGALGLMGSMVHFEVFTFAFQLVPVAINGLVAWYMMQPHVKQAFGT